MILASSMEQITVVLSCYVLQYLWIIHLPLKSWTPSRDMSAYSYAFFLASVLCSPSKTLCQVLHLMLTENHWICPHSSPTDGIHISFTVCLRAKRCSAQAADHQQECHRTCKKHKHHPWQRQYTVVLPQSKHDGLFTQNVNQFGFTVVFLNIHLYHLGPSSQGPPPCPMLHWSHHMRRTLDVDLGSH